MNPHINFPVPTRDRICSYIEPVLLSVIALLNVEKNEWGNGGMVTETKLVGSGS
jgi:hypothetical protein